MKSPNRIIERGSDRVFYVLSTAILFLLLVVVAYPLYNVLISSISNLNAINRGEVIFWPIGVHFDSYVRIFQNKMVLLGYRNTLFYTAAGTVVNLFMTMTGGYALSVKFFGRRTVMLFIIFTMYFSGGIIPTYFIYKNLGLIDTVWVMIIPGAVSAYYLIVARTFLGTNIPAEIYEAAQIDGCTRLRFFWSIVIPLSTILISILALFYAVGHWNAYFNALMFLNTRRYYPLPLVLREILIQNSIPIDVGNMDPEVAEQMNQIKELLKYSLIIIASVPVLILYPFLQRYFIRGLMIGSVKG